MSSSGRSLAVCWGGGAGVQLTCHYCRGPSIFIITIMIISTMISIVLRSLHALIVLHILHRVNSPEPSSSILCAPEHQANRQGAEGVTLLQPSVSAA